MYGCFAGRDATRAFATFDTKLIKDDYDDLSDLQPSDLEDALEWESRLRGALIQRATCRALNNRFVHFSQVPVRGTPPAAGRDGVRLRRRAVVKQVRRAARSHGHRWQDHRALGEAVGNDRSGRRISTTRIQYHTLLRSLIHNNTTIFLPWHERSGVHDVCACGRRSARFTGRPRELSLALALT